MNFHRSVALIYPIIKNKSGTRSYTENMISGLKEYHINFSEIGIKKHEISIHGKPYFGFISQYAASLLRTADSEIIHSLSPDCIIRNTNIVTVHDIIPIIRKDIYFQSFYDRLAFTKSIDRLLKVPNLLLSSEVGKTELLDTKNISENKIHVLHHAINHNVYFPSTNNPFKDDDSVRIVMVSDFNPRKRIDLLVKSLRNQDGIEFFHIGPINLWEKPYSNVMELSAGAKNIHILGELDPDRLRDYLSFSDLFVYLSEAEGFGLPPLEAMACGTNVLVSDLPIFHETLQDMAIFVNLEDFDVELLLAALKRRKTKNELVQFSQRYSIKRYIEGLLKIYGAI